MNYSSSVKKLIDLFSKFPTVGPRTAARFVFYLLDKDKEEVEGLLSAIDKLKKEVKMCRFCFKSFEIEGDLCEICSSKSRDRTSVCVVEKEQDLISLEQTKKYTGFYFILGGTVSGFKKKDVDKLRVKELEERIENPEKFLGEQINIQEIILALNPTSEGEATTLYIERALKKFTTAGKKITRLGRGLPVGGELEYADEETLSSSFENRK